MLTFLNKLDQDLFLMVNGIHASALDPVMVFLSGQLLWIPFILVFVWKGRSLLKGRKFFVFLTFLALTLVLSDVTSSYILKNIFTRLRPCRIAELKPLIYSFGQKCGGKFSFVSSHAANSAAIVYFCLNGLRLPRIYHAMWILPAVVGYSRIYLGVHYPGDIAGGFAVGLMWAGVMVYFFRNSTEQAEISPSGHS